MGKSLFTYLLGLISGLIVTGILLLVITPQQKYPIELRPPPSPAPLQVHMAGEVVHPGVYNMGRGSRLQDAIAAAGGTLPEADLDRVNLASELQDGMRIFIPSRTIESPPMDVADHPEVTGDDLININTATAPELEALPGIGPALAQKIIDYRDEHGLFQVAEDLLSVSGIGPNKLEEITPWITLY